MTKACHKLSFLIPLLLSLGSLHCMKSVCIRSYSGSYFPTFGLNRDENNSEYGHFSRSAWNRVQMRTTSFDWFNMDLPLFLRDGFCFVLANKKRKESHLILWNFLCNIVTQTLTIHRTAGEVRGPSFIPLYRFHPLTNIEIFICNFACGMTTRIFNRNACVYQAATRWDLSPYRITIWVIDWWCNVCLFTWWIDTRFLLQRLYIRNRWMWTRINYHPCITSEPTNKVC